MVIACKVILSHLFCKGVFVPQLLTISPTHVPEKTFYLGDYFVEWVLTLHGCREILKRKIISKSHRIFDIRCAFKLLIDKLMH
jgi:hypothetical protein